MAAKKKAIGNGLIFGIVIVLAVIGIALYFSGQSIPNQGLPIGGSVASENEGEEQVGCLLSGNLDGMGFSGFGRDPVLLVAQTEALTECETGQTARANGRDAALSQEQAFCLIQVGCNFSSVPDSLGDDACRLTRCTHISGGQTCTFQFTNGQMNTTPSKCFANNSANDEYWMCFANGWVGGFKTKCEGIFLPPPPVVK